MHDVQATGGASLTGDANSNRTGGRRRIGVLLAVAATVTVLDQVTKAMATAWLQDGRVVTVIDGIVELRLVRNPGAAFSIATNLTVVFTAIAAVVAVVILRASRRLTSLPWALALGTLLGGALGNLVDRLVREPGPLRGHVVDFVELPNWPLFNVADAAIVGAAVLIGWLSLRGVAYDAQAGPAGGAGPESAAGENDR
ncbi:MAG: signal peptidase II [Jiangellaceae bacterium]|nr:signal peptidase II [Jiangellaceae bacterium]